MIRKSRAAQAFLITLFFYYEIYRWIPLGKWNGQFRWPVQNDQFFPDIVIGLLLLAWIFAFGRLWRPGMWAAVLLLGLWASVHFLDWWVPYCQNSVANYPRYRFYAPHTQILPVVRNHYPPDAGHAVLDFILYPTWLLCFVAASGHRNHF